MSEAEERMERRVESGEILSRVKEIETWIVGPNGANGAEDRLKNIEKKVNAIFIMVGVVVGQSAIELLIGYLV